MNKLIDIPEEVIQKLKKKALKNKSRSVKKYMEDVLIEHAYKIK